MSLILLPVCSLLSILRYGVGDRGPMKTLPLVFLVISYGYMQGMVAKAADPTPPEDPRAAVAVIKDGESQIVDGFADSDYWIRHDLWVETESDSDQDGKLDRMHVAVTRPSQTESAGLKVPVIYATSPYFAGTGDNDRDFFWNPRQELGDQPPKRKIGPATKLKSRRPILSKRHIDDWVPRGFAVVHSSSPGTGLSQGCPTVGGDNESLAPKAVIDWLCGRGRGFTTVDGDQIVHASWCTGKVGMTGTSYNGTLPLAAATTGVEGLKAIIPVAPNTSYYHYYRSNGLVRHPGGYVGEDIDVLYDYIHSGNEDRREFCDCEVRQNTLQKQFARDNGDWNDFWEGRDYATKLGPLKAAVLMSHGFNDWNVMPEHSYRIIKELKKKQTPLQIYYHQKGHGGPPPMKMMNRWFTHYLRDVDNGVEDDAKAWIVREQDKNDEPTAYPDYPNPDASDVTLYPIAGAPRHGQLTRQAVTQKTIESFEDNFSFDGDSLAQAEWTDHRLIYACETLKRPLHLSGVSRVKIRLACDQAAANLSVWIVSLPWDDSKHAKLTENIITRGWADPQNHASLTESRPLIPGQFYDVQFDLQPDDQIIPAGQKIAWMIFSSDKDHTLHPDPGTKLSIDLSQTSLTLPVVGGADAYDEAFTDPPEDTEPPEDSEKPQHSEQPQNSGPTAERDTGS